MTAAEGDLSLEMRDAIDTCARGVACGLEAVAECEAAMLQILQDERTAMIGAVAEREAAMLRAVQYEHAAMLQAAEERESVMLWAVQEEREVALQALAESKAETSAFREALNADRATLDSEIGAMEAAVRCQESRVLLSVEAKERPG